MSSRDKSSQNPGFNTLIWFLQIILSQPQTSFVVTSTQFLIKKQTFMQIFCRIYIFPRKTQDRLIRFRFCWFSWRWKIIVSVFLDACQKFHIPVAFHFVFNGKHNSLLNILNSYRFLFLTSKWVLMAMFFFAVSIPAQWLAYFCCYHVFLSAIYEVFFSSTKWLPAAIKVYENR